MRHNSVLMGVIALAIAAPAIGQSVGMQVVDTAGSPVGTVTAIKGDNVQVKTDRHEALLPKSGFTVSGGKLLFGMTQAQLNAKIEEAAAASAQSIAAGATVNGLAGTPVGTIESVENGQVTISLTSGRKLQTGIQGLRGNPDGTATIGYTAEQLEALVKANEGASAGGQ